MFKYFILSLMLLPLCLASYGQAAKTSSLSSPKIDERIELVSIAARLAEYDEYNQEQYPGYVKDIHAWFDKYKDHAAIKLLRGLRNKNSLSFDAMMSMAVSMDQPPALKPAVAFSDGVPDKRWGADNATNFAAALNDFYTTTNAKAFFSTHQTLYSKIVERFNVVYNKLDVNWYKTYYGKEPKESFHIVLGLGNGGGNYGSKVVFPDQKTDVYAILGVWVTDSLGTPIFKTEDYLPTLIHEFNHSFVNYLSDVYETSLQSSMQAIFLAVQKEMARQAYGNWKTVFNEALVRASVVCYLQTHPLIGHSAKEEIVDQEGRGFYWISSLVDLLDKYQQKRDKYKRLEDFMPEIARYYDTLLPKLDSLKAAYQANCADVIGTVPMANDTLVNPGLKEIEFTFSKPMTPGRYAIGPTSKGKDHYPVVKNVTFINGNKTVKMEVELKPNTTYEMNVIGRLFKTEDGYQVKNYQLNFKTGQ